MNKALETKIEDLFRWKGELEITDEDGNVIETLYQRVVGDADIQTARLKALRNSRLLRKNLRNPESDEALARLPIEGELDKEDMVNTIIFSRYSTYNAKAEIQIHEERVKEPKSDATLEEQEEYIDAVEKAKQEYEAKLTSKINEFSSKDRDELMEKSYEEIMELHRKGLTDLLCNIEMSNTFDNMCAYLGTYSDPEFKKRRFNSFEEYSNISTSVKEKILNNYRRLPLDSEELKK